VTSSPQDGVRRSHLGVRHLGVWLVVLIGLAVALASALLVGSARSASHAQEGLIAFKRSDGIYLMRPDGSHVRPLKRARGSPVAHALDLEWSPDGSRLAFAAEDTIWAMDADGSDLVRFALPEGATAAMSPTWSPEGREIAYTAYQEGDRDIWVVSADGSEQRRLVRTPDAWEAGVDWSPSGGKLAVVSDGWVPRLWIMNADGTNRQRLTGRGSTGRVFEAFEPEWSPDGRRIAFAGDMGSGYDIYVIGLDGRPAVRLTTNFAVPDRSPTWSPDGRRIAFTRLSGLTDRSQEIHVMNADGTEAKRLTKNKVAERSPAWQPGAAP